MSKLNFTRNAVRLVTVVLMIGIVAIATADGFAQSYSGLYEWALLHKLEGWKADTFPLLVDLFILVGELGLFLLALDGYRLRKSFLAWTDILFPAAVAAAGWGVSLWFNVNHIPDATTEDKVTAGVPPVAAMVGLFIMLRTVHRYMSQLDDSPKPAPEPMPEPISPTGYAPLSAPETAGEIPPALPSPEPVSAPETPDERAPEPVPAVSPVVSPKSNGQPYGHGPNHPKWDEGVKLYRESVQGPGKAMSQRDLAAALGMRNRSLAAAIIKHVKGENDNGNGNGNGLSQTPEPGTSEES